MPEPPVCDCCRVNVFTSREAQDDLRRYRKQGAHSTTRALIDAIRAEGVDGATLLDIGAGIGVIGLELLQAGAARAESVDASEAFVAVARDEAARRGLAERTTHRLGDFVALADEVPAADVVTLDKVVCCYENLDALLGQAARHARRMVGLVHPPSGRPVRLVAGIVNAVGRLFGQTTRIYVHPVERIDAVLREAGFTGRELKRTLAWRVWLYVR